MQQILLIFILLGSSVWGNFNFGECSGSGTFEQEIVSFGKDYENAVTIGTIPKGIEGLYIELISQKDVDIRLYGENDDRIVHWPYGLLNDYKEENTTYQNTTITYSGYNGVNNKKGHEFIRVEGSVPTALTMKAFGYQAGYATVNYSWTGKSSCTNAPSGQGTFQQDILDKNTTIVGTIPPNINDVIIELTSENDIDIQLFSQDGTALVSWSPTGLISGAGKQTLAYKNMFIEWSGYNGTNGNKGNEYIKITGMTTQMLVMKVYGYQAGQATVNYSWGTHENTCGNNTIEADEECDDGNQDNNDGCSSLCKEEMDVAHLFGEARQGSAEEYKYYQPAINVLDRNSSTNNETQANYTDNWIEIKLPSPTLISSVTIQGAGNPSKLLGTKVYLSDIPYSPYVDPSQYTLIKTLETNLLMQTTSFDIPQSSNYVIIKAANKKALKLARVEVYGSVPQAPVFEAHKAEQLISGTTPNGTIITSLKATDYQGDTITYSLSDNLPFNIDNQGNIQVSGPLTQSTYNFDVKATDGTLTTITHLTINVTPSNIIEEVLLSGNILTTPVTQEELIQATLDEINQTSAYLQDTKIKIFNLNSDGSAKIDNTSLTNISWNPSTSSTLLKSTFGKNVNILYTNAVSVTSKPILKEQLAIIGKKGNARYMVLGTNPMRKEGNNEMNAMLENSLSWLTQKDTLHTEPFHVVLAHLAQRSGLKDEGKTRAWLDRHYEGLVNYNSPNSCENTQLSQCLTNDTDLLIISQETSDTDDIALIVDTVKQALDNNISVLYINQGQTFKALANALLPTVFSVNYGDTNSGKKLMLDNYNPTHDFDTIPTEYENIKTMFTHFKNADYSFDWSLCNDGKGHYGAEYEVCKTVPELHTEFLDAAKFIKSMIETIESNQKDIFQYEGNRFIKLLILTADSFRQSIQYPMDKVKSNTTTFMKALYADYTIYDYRHINPRQLDLGNFSRSDFSHITPTTKIVSLNSKMNFRSAGVYALPGQTMKITRNDTSDVVVKVFINSLRAASTHAFGEDGYKRPKYLRSYPHEIKPGQTIEITSAYGGPVQLEFFSNNLPVNLKFENIGEHPYWRSSADNISFAEKMQSHEYDWAEIATPGFEVHSRFLNMTESINNPKWGGTAEGLANAIVQYTFNYPHVLRGYQGEGLDVVDEIHDWANSKGITIENFSLVKHMNADQSSSGAVALSGNPYDANWAFDPIAQGDLHELGHNMQRKRFEGFGTHSATNTFAYYSKSRYFENTGEDPECHTLPFKEVFNTIQASINETNSTKYVKENLWDTAYWAEAYILKMNMYMHAQKMGTLKNGWHLLARLHILEMEMERAKLDWESRKNSVGFSTYSLDEIDNIRDNDWLVISHSYAAELDFRDYFDMMGIPYSQKARDQIASFNFPMVPKELFVLSPDGYCKEDAYGRLFDRTTLPMDGVTNYPY